MVVYAFVYRKHCKFCRCTVALTLQLKHQHNGDEHGNYITKESCNGRLPHGRACDLINKHYLEMARTIIFLSINLFFKIMKQDYVSRIVGTFGYSRSLTISG
jgi:hypothetical protein